MACLLIGCMACSSSYGLLLRGGFGVPGKAAAMLPLLQLQASGNSGDERNAWELW